MLNSNVKRALPYKKKFSLHPEMYSVDHERFLGDFDLFKYLILFAGGCSIRSPRGMDTECDAERKHSIW